MTDRAAILMALKPHWWGLIRTGRKTVELRRVTPKQLVPGMPIVWYVSQPVSAIVGEAVCSEVNDTRPRRGLSLWEDVWTTTECYNLVGLPPDEIRKYWAGASSPCAIWLREVREYARPLEWGAIGQPNWLPHPPRSYRYLTADQLAAIRAAGGADDETA